MINYGKRVIDRRKANEAARPRAVESREDRLEKQLKILADRLTLAIMTLFDGHSFMKAETVIAQLDYLENAGNEVLKMEQTPSVGLSRPLDARRKTTLYRTIMSSVRHLVRIQYQEDKFQP